MPATTRIALLAACVLLLGGACGGRTTMASMAPSPLPGIEVPPSTVTTPPPPDGAPAAAPSHVDPFAATAPAAAAASSRPGLEVTGQIEIPSIGLVATTYEGNTLPVIDHGPSHWPGTAMPGDLGNTVFAGHRVTHTHPFLNLDLVKPGDPVVFTTAAGRFVYQVDETIIVTPDQLWIVDPTPGATMTLFGCHPKHQKTHRIVVRGHLVSAERNPQGQAAPGDHPAPSPSPAPGQPPAGQVPPSTTTTTSPPASSSRCNGLVCVRP